MFITNLTSFSISSLSFLDFLPSLSWLKDSRNLWGSIHLFETMSYYRQCGAVAFFADVLFDLFCSRNLRSSKLKFPWRSSCDTTEKTLSFFFYLDHHGLCFRNRSLAPQPVYWERDWRFHQFLRLSALKQTFFSRPVLSVAARSPFGSDVGLQYPNAGLFASSCRATPKSC